MEPSPRVIDFDDVIELCGSVATSRGSVYKASGAVRELDWLAEKQTLYSSVQGTDTEPYRQRIAIAAHQLDGECSCPVRFNCKHVAAALLRWIDEQDNDPGDADRKLRAVNRWLQRMVDRQRHSTASLEAHTPGEPLLFYQLDENSLSQHRSGITVSVLQSRLLKRGGYGKETPYRYHSHYHHPEWVLPGDRAILELASSRQGDFSYRPLTLDGDIGHLLMSKLIDTGRCFWGPERDTPLTIDQPRSLSMCWQPVAKHALELDVQLPGAENWHLVPADPPWYIDTDRCVAGQLIDTPPVTILQDLLSAPPVPHAHAQTVSNYLASRLHDTRLPLPMSPNFIRVDVPPEPLLILQSRDDSQDIRDYFASIRFRYDSYVLPFDGSAADATLEGKTQDGESLVLKRDLAAEAARVAAFSKRFGDFESALATDPDYYSRADHKPRTRDVQSVAQSWRSLLDSRDELEADGWEIQCREPFDLSFTRVSSIRASLESRSNDWFDIGLELRYGDEYFDLLPLVIGWLQDEQRERSILLQAKSGQWLEVAPEVFRPVADTLLELLEEPASAKRLTLPRQRAMALEAFDDAWQEFGVTVKWQGAEDLFALAERLASFSGITPPSLPAALEKQLRAYQLDGVGWLGFLAEFGFNGILADDMGLGKTLQTLAHLLHERAIGRLTAPTLIVAPTSLLVNWQREIERFTPSLRHAVWHGPDRHTRELCIEQLDILITSYALVTRDIAFLNDIAFGAVVLDEAQAIKNPAAKITRTLKSMRVGRRLCLTGTPMENHLGELWSLFDFLMPGVLGSRRHFNRYYRTPIETHADTDRQARLTELVRPFLLRRRKEQVAAELPAKTEIIREVTLEGAQARLYESIRVSMEQRVRQLLKERGLSRSHIELLDALLKLRQTCCHPALVKLDSARGVSESAKTELLLEMLEELIAEGKKILLFSQFTEMLSLIEKEISARDIDFVKLTGRTRKRTEAIDAFQHGTVPLFLISLKAGGTGLNLTAADTVIHYDPWWNPAVENQASDRAHRIGQDKPVFIYKLVASNTVEERILRMQAYKQALADRTVNESGRSGPLTADDFLALFADDDDSRHVA